MGGGHTAIHIAKRKKDYARYCINSQFLPSDDQKFCVLWVTLILYLVRYMHPWTVDLLHRTIPKMHLFAEGKKTFIPLANKSQVVLDFWVVEEGGVGIQN